MKSVLQIFVIIAQFLLFIPVAWRKQTNIQVMKLDSQGLVLLIIFSQKKAKTLIIMINIANNSLVNNTQNNIPKFTLWGENMATLEDSGTLFGSLNLVLILDIGNKKM